MAGALKRDRHLVVVRPQGRGDEFEMELKRNTPSDAAPLAQQKGVGKLLNPSAAPVKQSAPTSYGVKPRPSDLENKTVHVRDETTRHREIPKDLLETLRQNVKVEDKYRPQVQSSRPARRTNAIYHSEEPRLEQKVPVRNVADQPKPSLPNTALENKPRANNWMPTLLVVGALAFGLWGYRTGFISLSSRQSGAAQVDDYRSYWLSGQPSLMRQVLSAATEDPPVFEAEAAIVTAAVKGEKVARVRGDLIRVAFDARWEEQLTDQDRTLAITLGAAELVPDKLKDLPPLSEAHPGIALAVAVQLDIDKPFAQLSKVAVSRLAKLPEPIGIAFRELEHSGVRALSERSAMALCHIIGAVIDERILAAYFDRNLEHRLVSILGIIKLSQDSALSDRVFRYIKGTQSALAAQLNWFDQEPTAEWEKLEPYSKLMIGLGGEVTGLTLAQNSDLLAFPIEPIRKTAASEIKKQLSRQLDRIVDVLSEPRNKLTRLQNIFLLSALSVKDKSRDSLIAKWFTFAPEPQTVLDLLIAHGEMTQPDNFSFEAARYLIGIDNLQTSFEQLKQLTTNPEPLARALAYARFNLADKSQSKLLEAMSVVEPNGDLRQKIMEKIQLELGVTGMND